MMNFIIPTLLTLAAVADAMKGCGQPGRPGHGRFTLKRDGFTLSAVGEYLRGDELVYSCDAGYSLLGPRQRWCHGDGTWRPDVPSCDMNLALSEGNSSVQSKTFGNYSSDFATDGNPETCAIIERTKQQRWWQMKLNKKISLKAVKIHIKKDALTALTVFMIEMLPGNLTHYNLCGRYNNSGVTSPLYNRSPRKFVTDTENQSLMSRSSSSLRHDDDADTIDVSCENQDAVGHYIFIRDDRKKEDYFKICEVEVFSFNNKDDCGDPELPLGSLISTSTSNTKWKKEVLCKEGLNLIDTFNEDISNIITCSQGRWNSSHIKCQSKQCPELDSVSHGKIVMEFDDYDVMYRARVVCDRGHVTWGHSHVSCDDGTWSDTAATCRPLSCGHPAPLEFASVVLTNGTTLWRDEAVYKCNPGYLMVVNDSSAQPDSVSVCSDDGEWSRNTNIKCVDASQLDGYLSGPARISINIIYCLLALLIVMSAPLLVFYCCGNKCGANRNKTSSQLQMSITPNSKDDEDSMSQKTNQDSGLSTGSSILPSPKVGIYSVSSGMVLQPATVSPNTLRSFSATANSFKPFSYTAQPVSMPVWQGKERNVTRSSLPFHFESPMMSSDFHDVSKQEPVIDEAGYASLILKQNPIYEPVRESTVSGRSDDIDDDVEEVSVANTYDDVPRTSDTEHNYANIEYPDPVTIMARDSSASYPDLLQMVTKTPPSAPEPPGHLRHSGGLSEPEVDNLYAKVDLTRKRSRPNSSESGDTVVNNTKNNLDSYTKTLIEKFNLFLEQGGHTQSPVVSKQTS